MQKSARPRSRDAIPIHHLLNAPDGDEFIERFPIRDNPEAVVGVLGEQDHAGIGDAEDSSEASHWGEDYEQNDVFIEADIHEFGVPFDTFLGGLETMTFGHFPLNHDLSQITNVASQTATVLEPRAFEIRQLLMDTAHRLAMAYPEDPSWTHLGGAIQLLTHTELDYCVNLFFANYHRHCPILHRPSFCATMVPIPLLLSTAALGAMYAPDPTKVAWMKSLFDVMEAYIFALPGLRDETMGGFMLTDAPDEETLNYRFQIFQGAYLMIVTQFFSGNLAGRRRARRQRFCTILSVCFAVVSLSICLTAAPRLHVRLAFPLLNIQAFLQYRTKSRSGAGCRWKPVFGKLTPEIMT